MALAIGALVLAIAPTAAHSGGGKSFRIDALRTTATVHPDGSMSVVEHVTYAFSGGSFTIGVRSFDDPDRVESFAVTEGGAALDVVPPARTPTGQWEWEFGRPARDEQRTFMITYEVDDAVAVGPDVGELYWQFVGDDHPAIGAMDVEVRLPGDAPNATDDADPADAGVVRAWGHGPPGGVVALGDQLVTASLPNVPAGRFVELRVLVPATEFDVAPSGAPRLARVLDEEGAFIDGSGFGDTPARPRPGRTVGRWLAPISAGFGLLSALALGLRFGREPASTEVLGEYWREPLDDPPAIVLTTLKRGTVPAPQAIAGTLIELAQRDYLRITTETQERLGPDKVTHTFHWLGKPLDASVRPFEADLLEMVFRGQTQTDEDELRAWARANQKTATARLHAWQKAVKDAYRSCGYDAPMSGRPAAYLTAVCVLTLAAGIVATVLGTRLGWVAIGASVIAAVVGFPMLANRTQRGAEAAAKAEGLERFLRDFSNLEDAPVGHLILWERYLVDAVTLGVAAELLRNLAIHLPQVAQDPAFATFYTGAHGRFDGLDAVSSIGTTISTSFSPPSKSGSGGGFSGGGGGGGGGGGFGAR